MNAERKLLSVRMADVPLRSRVRPDLWGGLRLQGNCLEYPAYSGGNSYDVDLLTLTSSAKVLDFIMQIDTKTWASAACMSGLVRALDDILNPQGNLCSGGGDKRLTAAQIRRLVKRSKGK